MAVYTEVPDGELAAFVKAYDIGEVVSCKGIAEGVENSNFLMRTTKGSYILTLYEKRVNRSDLPFFLGLMEHLAAKGLSCPTPIKARDGEALRELCGRPAAIISFLEGMWPRRPTERHCQLLGGAMADLHIKGRDFALKRPNNLSLAGWRTLVANTKDRADEVSPGLADTIQDELAFLEKNWPQDLEVGVIHADLFPDNVFFLGDRLSGLIDFYFACTDFLVYDVAICLNAWCFEQKGEFNVTKAKLMIESYAKLRPLPEAELAAMPVLARGGALRFLLTRLYDWLNHPPGAFVSPKDPLEYLKKLRFHQQAKSVAAYGL
ncbi:homoserine kinase [Dongia rigui]|uniref:Homoserine kinase n=1 Tax=Dongia rigui TaxID=940149 RepID=A0ABU5DXG1_9PROT|nr:homoserine kinase [Dongia rigui]MDY0871398.1 homoserine kinase [Dongia rigui]